MRDKNKITLENLYKNSKGNDSLPLKGNQKNTIYINEPGLYQLIMKSKLKEAEKFQDWITDDLLQFVYSFLVILVNIFLV